MMLDMLEKQKQSSRDRLVYCGNLIDQFGEVENAIRLIMQRLESPAHDRVTEEIKPHIVVKEFGKVIPMKPGSANMAENWGNIVKHIARTVLKMEEPNGLFVICFQLSDFCYSERAFEAKDLKQLMAGHEKKLMTELINSGKEG